MNIVALTKFPAGCTLGRDKDGHEYLIVIAKGTFGIGAERNLFVANEQHPLTFADIHNGDPENSSIRYESDFALRKLRTDVILNGSAHAPEGNPVGSVDVAIEVGPVRKVMRVFGDRVWDRRLGFMVPSDPMPFLTMPLVYERSYGGSDPNGHVLAASNLAGVASHSGHQYGALGTPLPNVERPEDLITRPSDKPTPIGFGFVSRNWMPRRAYAGTYDQAWIDERYPFLPLDFDDRYFQGAPEDQICDHLRGGERVRLTNLSPNGRLEFNLPIVSVPVRLVRRHDDVEVPTALDTVILEPDASRLMLIWRATIRLRGKLSDVVEIWVGTPTRGLKRSLESGKRYIDWRKSPSVGTGS